MDSRKELTQEVTGKKIVGGRLGGVVISKVLYISKGWDASLEKSTWDIEFIDQWGNYHHYQQGTDGGEFSKEKVALTINQTDKKAGTLALVQLKEDEYHEAINDAAFLLSVTGKEDWKYHTQYGLGSCVFRSPDNKDSITVNPTEEVIR
jgi:hypothetical protein